MVEIKDKKNNNLVNKERRIDQVLKREIKKLKKDTILYINYPFCSNFCNFCIYKVHLYNQADSKEFLDYYKKEISLYADALRGFKFRNVHIGGGTPNLIPPNFLIEPLKKVIDFNNLDRFIIEVFPSENLGKYLDELKKYNVTKIQLGVQTIDEKILKQENRKVSKKAILNSIKALSERDFIWSVDLMYGFKNDSLYKKNRISEFQKIISFNPNGIHFYKLRSQRTNCYYDKKNCNYDIYEKEIDLSGFENILIKKGYKKIYDEWCLGKNKEHAQISVCYNGYSKAFPDILGLGLIAKSHFRFGLTVNFKDFETYKKLLDRNMFPIRVFHNFKRTNIYPVFNIYTGIKRLSEFDLGSFLKNNKLTKAEEKEIDSIFFLFDKHDVKYNYKRGILKIDKTCFPKTLRLIERYMRLAYFTKNN